MPKDGECNGDENGVEATKVFVGDDGTDDGSSVGPEGVELADAEGSALTHAQGAGLAVRAGITTGGLLDAVDDGEVLLDEVGVCDN